MRGRRLTAWGMAYSTWLWHPVALYVGPNLSEEAAASWTFKNYPEDGGNSFPWNVVTLLLYYIT
jgi:hypothetical protein